MKYFVLIISFFICHISNAQQIGPMQNTNLGAYVDGTDTKFTSIAINSPVSINAVNVTGFRFLTFDLDYTHSAGTDVTMTCYKNQTLSGTYSQLQIISETAGTGIGVSYDRVLTKPVTTSKKWPWTIALSGYNYIKCTFTAVGGDANDKLTVTLVGGI